MLRGSLLVVLLAGCRQILGLDPAQVAPGDAMTDTIPDVADRSERMKVVSLVSFSPVTGVDSFPLWFAIQDGQVAARARADGSDIHFRTENGEPLAFEIQQWDPSTGRLEAWVKLGKAGRPFELHYGEPANPISEDAGQVFTRDDGFAAVWHLEDTFSSVSIVDATGATATTLSGLGPINRQAAKLGAGLHMTDVAQRIQFVNPLVANTSHTISAWVKLDPAVSYDPLVVVGAPSTNDSRWIHARYAANRSVGFGMYGNDHDSGYILPEATWTQLHWVYEAPARTSRLYVDGLVSSTFVHANGVSTAGSAGYVGYAPIQWGPNLDTETGMNGVLDEVRIQTVARSNVWVAADFASQNSPDSTYSLGPEQLP